MDGKTAGLVLVAIVGWFFYFQLIDWFFMKTQGLNYFSFLDVI